MFPPETQPNRVGRCGPNRVGRCGLGGVKGHIKAFEKVKQGGAPCKIDAGGNSARICPYKVNRGNSIVFFQIEIIFLHFINYTNFYNSTSISTYIKFHALSTEYKVETRTIKTYSLDVKQTMGARVG